MTTTSPPRRIAPSRLTGLRGSVPRWFISCRNAGPTFRVLPSFLPSFLVSRAGQLPSLPPFLRLHPPWKPPSEEDILLSQPCGRGFPPNPCFGSASFHPFPSLTFPLRCLRIWIFSIIKRLFWLETFEFRENWKEYERKCRTKKRFERGGKGWESLGRW